MSNTVDAKLVVIKLFYNKANHSFYVQIGTEMLFIVKEMVATRIQNKEGIEITHVDDIKQIQTQDRYVKK